MLRCSWAIILILTLGPWLWVACGDEASNGNSSAPTESVKEIFTEESVARGIRFVHSTGATGKRYMPEMLGSGGAFFDADGDGDLDLLLINGGQLPGERQPALNALFLNDGSGSFTATPDAGGMEGKRDYGVGCAVADIDDDGDLDVFVSNFGPDRLFVNDGKGKFSEESLRRGITGTSWGSSAAFGDVNGDGRVDLYVANYVKYALNDHTTCHQGPHEIYCGPQPFDGAPDALYLNQGRGRFRNVTAQQLKSKPTGKGLGVAMVDFDHDGDLDIYVANDETPNNLWENDGQGGFTDIALIAGVALSHDAAPEAGMGVAFADFDNDTFEDIIVTNFEDQVNSVYRNTGDGLFDEISFEVGVGYDSRPLLGWGGGFIDVDRDGFKDVFYANGHIYDNAHLLNDNATWEQPNRLQLNQRNGTFGASEDVICKALETKKVSRSAIFGDIDNDGDVDILVTAIDDIPEGLINNARTGNWLMVAARSESGAYVPGARIVLKTETTTQSQTVQGGYSYLSHNDTRAHFGLGDNSVAKEVTVIWPGGGKSTATDVKAGGILIFQKNKPTRFETDLTAR